MATITAAPVLNVASPYNTTPSYSGTFIPTIWSAKMNAKFYAATVFGEIANTNWQGEIADVGDKVIINDIPTLTISDYTPGTALQYQVPTPSTQELQINNAKSFAFRVDDVLRMQSKPNLIDTFSGDAAQQMKIAIDSTVLFGSFDNGASDNKGATAGRITGAYNLGTKTAPVTLSATNTLSLITSMAAVLDEQNVPESDRFLVIDPATRNWLMQSPLAQAYFTNDSQSIVRNGKIGMIDRFTVYVSNLLPRKDAAKAWTIGTGDPAAAAADAGTAKARAIIAGHKSAITFASQMTKVETLRIQDNFGDYVRGLNVFGYKVVKPESLVLACVV